ncbi:MAG TPA: cyclic nucleotide-binding domain-containing protein [Anaerolineales bacterium]|nr:cyclic nucleotide-binding domain-containing protein [Anaerolineales bacterium]
MRAHSPIDLLRMAHFLRDLDDSEIEHLATALQPVDLDAGQEVFRQGDRPDALFFVSSGEVEVLRSETGKPQRRVGMLVVGDTLGEIEMIYRQPRQATIRATRQTTLFRWNQEPLQAFMREHPAALASLRFAADSRRLARRLQFRWLSENESIYAVARKHPALLYQALSVPFVLLLAAGLGFVWAFSSGESALAWLAGGLGLVGLGYGAWRWLDWGNDFYIVTSKRAIWLEKVIGLYESRQEAPLQSVLSVSVSTDVASRALGFGDVVIRTYTGQLVFHNVGNPLAMAAMVEEHWRRVRLQRVQEDRETILATLQERLAKEEGEGQVPRIEIKDRAQEERLSTRIGLDRWTFQVRFEEKGVITYRKHWAILLGHIGGPSALVLLVAAVVGARLGGWLLFMSTGATLTMAALALVPLSLWWLYQYVDWANDIYQVTPAQILDVYKKPLAREVRKVAPLENILGTEVAQRGILGLLLNFGDVVANVGTEKFTFQGVFDPTSVQQDIVRAQEAFNERKKEKERRERREEMVEWLSAYHKEAGQQGADQG